MQHFATEECFQRKQKEIFTEFSASCYVNISVCSKVCVYKMLRCLSKPPDVWMWPCKRLHWADSTLSLSPRQTAFKLWYRGTESHYYLKPRSMLRHSHTLVTSCQSTGSNFSKRPPTKTRFPLSLVSPFLRWLSAF